MSGSFHQNSEEHDTEAASEPANIEVRDANYRTAAEQRLVIGGWYVFYTVEPSFPDGYCAGAIAEYVGEGQFYDEGDEDPVRVSYYDFVILSHMDQRLAQRRVAPQEPVGSTPTAPSGVLAQPRLQAPGMQASA